MMDGAQTSVQNFMAGCTKLTLGAASQYLLAHLMVKRGYVVRMLSKFVWTIVHHKPSTSQNLMCRWQDVDSRPALISGLYTEELGAMKERYKVNIDIHEDTYDGDMACMHHHMNDIVPSNDVNEDISKGICDKLIWMNSSVLSMKRCQTCMQDNNSDKMEYMQDHTSDKMQWPTTRQFMLCCMSICFKSTCRMSSFSGCVDDMEVSESVYEGG